MYKEGDHFTDLPQFSLISHENERPNEISWNNLVSMRPNYFIFIGYLKQGVGISS